MKIDDRIELARIVRQRRTQQNLSQTDLGKTIKVSRHTIAGIEAGTANISIETLFRLLSVLNLRIDILLRSAAGADATGEPFLSDVMERLRRSAEEA